MKTPEIPPRSWLFNVPLLGRGTGQVESLASFVARVSEEHFHRPSGLLHRGLEWHAIGKPENVGRWLRGTKKLQMGWAINGHRNATRWVEVLESQMMVSNLQEAKGEALSQLASIHQIFRKTDAFYTALAAEVIGLDRVFLDEQVRQGFRPAGELAGVGEPVRGVLDPALGAHASAVDSWVWKNLHCLLGPAFPYVPDLVDTAALLLQDPQQRIGGEVTADEQVEELVPLTRFSPEDNAAAEALLERMPDGAFLGDLIVQGRNERLSPAVLRNVVLRSLMCYEAGGPYSADPDGHLADPEFSGNNLRLRKSAS